MMARLNSSSENEGLFLQSQSQGQTSHRSITSSSKLKTYGRRRAKLVEIKGGNTAAVAKAMPREEKGEPMRIEAGFKSMDDDEDEEEEDVDQEPEHEQDTSAGDIIYEPRTSDDTSFDYIIHKPRESGARDAEGGGEPANGLTEGDEGNGPTVGVSSTAVEAQEKLDEPDDKRDDEPANSQLEENAAADSDAEEEAEKGEPSSSAMPVLKPAKKRGRPSREDKSAKSQVEANTVTKDVEEADASSAEPILKPAKKRGRPSREDKSANSQVEASTVHNNDGEEADASSAEPVLKAPRKRGRPSGSSSSNKVPKTTKTTRPSTGDSESDSQNRPKAAFAVVEFLAAGLKRFNDGPLEKALLARWDGYPLVEDLTWEPERNMLEDAPELVQEFYKAWEV